MQNPLYGQQCNPARMEWRRADNPYHRAWDDPRFPYVLTTYRLTEHHTAGGMSRWLSWLCRAAAGDVLRGLARAGRASAGCSNGGWATITHRARARSRRACW